MFSSNMKGKKKYLNETSFSNKILLTLKMIIFSWLQCGEAMIFYFYFESIYKLFS